MLPIYLEKYKEQIILTYTHLLLQMFILWLIILIIKIYLLILVDCFVMQIYNNILKYWEL